MNSKCKIEKGYDSLGCLRWLEITACTRKQSKIRMEKQAGTE